MRTVINIGELLFDVANKSHAETLAAFPDPEERYRYEAGTEKRDEVLRCLDESLSRLDVALEEFTIAPHQYLGTNAPGLADTDAVMYDFPPSARRYASQAPAVAALLHSYLANSTLALFYASVGLKDTSALRAELAASDLEAVTRCLHTKTRPVRSKPYM